MNTPSNPDAIQIYSDGACRGNPGPGGWGTLLRYRDHEKPCMVANPTRPTTAWSCKRSFPD